MAYWLFKTEPGDYSWDQLVADGEADWDGVRNHQAANNMRTMRKGEHAFFYRSVKDPAVVGIMAISHEAFPDPDDQRFARVRVKPVRPLKEPVTLKAIKAEPALAGIPLIRQSRLSVMPIPDEAWARICRMGGIEPDG